MVSFYITFIYTYTLVSCLKIKKKKCTRQELRCYNDYVIILNVFFSKASFNRIFVDTSLYSIIPTYVLQRPPATSPQFYGLTTSLFSFIVVVIIFYTYSTNVTLMIVYVYVFITFYFFFIVYGSLHTS